MSIFNYSYNKSKYILIIQLYLLFIILLFIIYYLLFIIYYLLFIIYYFNIYYLLFIILIYRLPFSEWLGLVKANFFFGANKGSRGVPRSGWPPKKNCQSGDAHHWKCQSYITNVYFYCISISYIYIVYLYRISLLF